MLLSKLSYFLVVFLLIFSCYTDIFYRKIKNKIIFFILIVILADAIFYHHEISYLQAVIILIFGIILFYFSILGAGDVKLLAVLSLSIKNDYIIDFIMIISLCGLPLIVVILISKRFFATKKSLPYCLAITAAYITLNFLV